MNHVSRAYALLLLLAVAVPVASAQSNATTDDLDAMENRLMSEIDTTQADLQDWVSTQHTQTANVIRNRLNDIDDRIAVINTTILPAIQGMTAKTDAQSAAIDDLIDQAALTAELLTAMRHDMSMMLQTIEVLRNETFQDHVNLYQTLTDENGNPLLPKIQQQVDDNREAQEVITLTQYRMRADMDNMTSMMVGGFNTVNDGQEATFVAADSSAGRITFTNVVLVMMFVSNLVLLSYAFKVPKKLWDRIAYEGRRVESRGEYVEPNCPAPEADAKEFGDFHGCEYGEGEDPACPVAEECKVKAVEKTQDAVLNGETPVPAHERIDEEEVVDVGEDLKAAQKPKARVMDLSAFGGA